MYEGDVTDGAALAPFAAVAGIGFGLDWLLMLAVVGVVGAVIFYRRRGRSAQKP